MALHEFPVGELSALAQHAHSRAVRGLLDWRGLRARRCPVQVRSAEGLSADTSVRRAVRFDLRIPPELSRLDS